MLRALAAGKPKDEGFVGDVEVDSDEDESSTLATDTPMSGASEEADHGDTMLRDWQQELYANSQAERNMEGSKLAGG
jgi:hypothetical protein